MNESQEKMPGEPLLILLVEDNTDHAELAKRSLKQNRVANRIHHVEDAESALAFLEQGLDDPAHDLPNLILLDIQLPEMSGLEALEKIKQNQRLAMIPIVMLTSSKADPDVERAYRVGANSYLIKPMDFASFTNMMSDLGYYWLAWNVRPGHGDSRPAEDG